MTELETLLLKRLSEFSQQQEKQSAALSNLVEQQSLRLQPLSTQVQQLGAQVQQLSAQVQQLSAQVERLSAQVEQS